MRRKIISALALLLPLLLLATATTATPATPDVQAPQVSSPTRLLFVGNSYLYYNNSVHGHLRQIIIGADPSMHGQLKFKSATIGGARLEHHNIDWLTQPGNIGVKLPFEIVVLQGDSAAALTEPRRIAFKEIVQKHASVIQSRGGKLALYMPPAYVEPHKRVSDKNILLNESLYVTTGNDIKALVIPVGLAFEESYRRDPKLRLHAPDGSHPSLYGTYLAAATCYAALYGKSPVGNPYDASGQIAPQIAHFLQQVAWDTVQRFYQKTTENTGTSEKR